MIDLNKMKKTKCMFGDFQIKGKEIPDNSIDCILTDPPYEKKYLYLWKDLSLLASKVLKPSGFLVAYSGQHYIPDVVKGLSEHMTFYWMFGLVHEKGSIRTYQFVNLKNKFKPVFIYQKSPCDVLVKGWSSKYADKEYPYEDMVTNEYGEKD